MPEHPSAAKALPAGTKVCVITPGDPPEWSDWDDDGGRISPPLKKRLQIKFFKGDPKLAAEILYIGNESERDALKRKNRTKVRIRESSGATLVITADLANLRKR